MLSGQPAADTSLSSARGLAHCDVDEDSTPPRPAPHSTISALGWGGGWGGRARLSEACLEEQLTD